GKSLVSDHCRDQRHQSSQSDKLSDSALVEKEDAVIIESEELKISSLSAPTTDHLLLPCTIGSN
ncbi:Bgt-20212-4, partial [Blumeria graminis f. sp. tritici]